MRRYLRHLSGNGLAGTTVNQAFVLLAGIGSGVTLARSLGPAGRGELAAVLLWSGILGLFGDMGLGFAFSYYSGKMKERIDEFWTLSISSGLLIGGVLALAGWIAIPHFVHPLRGMSQRGDLGWALLSIPVILANGFQSYLLLGRNLVRDYNLIRITNAVSYLIIVMATSAIHPTARNFVIAYLLAQLCGLTLCTVLVIRRFHPRPRFERSLVRKLLSYGLKTQVASLAAQTNLRADQAIMSIVLQPAQFGLYVVAVSVSGVLSPLMNALTVVILPRTTHAESELAGVLLVARHVKLACLLSIPVIAVAVLLMPWVLPMLFGHAFAPAVLTAQILVVASLFQGLNAMLGNSLRGLGHPSLPALGEGAGMLITVSLLFLLLPGFGIAGAAVASLCAYSFVAIAEFILVARVAGMSSRHLALSSAGDPLLEKSRQVLRALLRPVRVAPDAGRE